MARSAYVSNILKGHVVYYCKDCEKIVETKPVGRKFVYRCAVCGTKNVAFGTEKTIRAFYRVKEEEEIRNPKSE
ncbi:hypothetical protein KJ951_02550 [Patescibacteria group bacterium]|nr:hypothetical protein [Patescibacteria group bacterium]MBU1703260.1 hypothetical protein [Patescibacteria group bacterium]MBU1953760.1 hypothetical protein [Patescibacteria group bacterium]